MTLTELVLSFLVDTKGLDKGLNEARQKIDQGARQLGQSLMSPFKAALGQLAAGLSLAAITRQYLQQADAIGKMADSIGADMEELQAWGEAAKQAGGSAEAFQGTVQSLTRNLQQAAASAKGPAAQALAELGVKATDATGKARDSFEVLRDLAGVMEGMDKQKAMALGQRVGIDRGTIMLLQSGRAAVENLITEMKDLGLYTKEDQEIAGKANQTIAKLGLALKSGAAIIMRQVVPAITWVTDKAIKVVQFLKKNQPFVTAGLGVIASILTARLVPALLKVAAAQAKAWAPFYVIGAIIAGIALVIDDFWTYLNGGNSALEDLWKTFGEGPELLATFKKTWEDVKNTFLDVFNSAKQKAIDFFSYFDGVLPPLIMLFEGVGNIIKGIFNWDFKTLGKGLAQALIGAVEAITEVFSGLWKYIADSIGDISWEGLKNGAKQAWENVKQFAIGFFEALPQDAQEKLVRLWTEISNAFKWENIKEKFKDVFNIDLDVIGQKIADLFNIDWKGLTEKFKKLWEVDWEQLKQSILNIFPSWEDIKKEFQSVFDFVPNLDKIIDAIKDGFKKAWDWILENIPGAKLFFDTGKNMVEAAKNVDASEGEQTAEDAALDLEEKMQANREAMRPAPTESVSSQAATASTQTTTNNLTQTDSRQVSVTINAPNGDPQALGNAAAKALDKRPAWMTQAAVGNAVAGAN